MDENNNKIVIEYDEIKDKFYLSNNSGAMSFFGEWAFQEHLRCLSFPEDRIEELTNEVLLNERVEI